MENRGRQNHYLWGRVAYHKHASLNQLSRSGVWALGGAYFRKRVVPSLAYKGFRKALKAKGEGLRACPCELIADFFNQPILVDLSRYNFLGFVVAGFGIAPSAYLFRELKVKQRSIAQILSITISGVTGIMLALNGYSYWGPQQHWDAVVSNDV